MSSQARVCGRQTARFFFRYRKRASALGDFISSVAWHPQFSAVLGARKVRVSMPRMRCRLIYQINEGSIWGE